MDAQRFDRLTRAAAGGSRRGLLLGLAGMAALSLAALRGGSAAARRATAGPGDPCRVDSDCLAADAPLICDDNGFDYDGALNCCTFEGSRCGSDEGCCWDNACVGGICTSVSVSLGPGDRCNPGDRCIAADAAVTCDYVAAIGEYRCCSLEGSRCGWDGDCCGGASCLNGFCAYPAVYAGPGEPCSDSSQCVAADTAVTCDYNAKTNDYRCCAYEGSRCGWDGACCGWLRCNDDGFCTGRPPTGCADEGCECDFHDPNACADGLVCCAVQSGFICAKRTDCGG